MPASSGRRTRLGWRTGPRNYVGRAGFPEAKVGSRTPQRRGEALSPHARRVSRPGGVSLLRKAIFGVMIGALVFATAAWAAQQNNTFKYRSTAQYKGHPSKAKPKNLTYTGILDVGTEEGTQPNTAALTELFIAKQLKTNGSKFK